MTPGNVVQVLIPGRMSTAGLVSRVQPRDGRPPRIDVVVVTDQLNRYGGNVSLTLHSVPHVSDTADPGANPVAAWDEPTLGALTYGPAIAP